MYGTLAAMATLIMAVVGAALVIPYYAFHLGDKIKGWFKKGKHEK